jgi:hypothetical protein
MESESTGNEYGPNMVRLRINNLSDLSLIIKEN